MGTRIYTKEIINYFYEQNGLLYWNIDKNYNALKNSLAGCLDKDSGYYKVIINGKSYYNHRILYQIYHNVILQPNEEVDHINGIKTDNRKENLRISTRSQNCCNRRSGKNNLSTGLKNIFTITNKSGSAYYYVKIIKNRKIVYSELFRTDKYTLEEVKEIRDQKLKEIHGEFHNLG